MGVGRDGGSVVVGYLKVEKCKEVKLFSSLVLWQALERIAGGRQMTSCLTAEKRF